MSQLPPKPPKRSLLERADDRFDFGTSLRRIEPGSLDDDGSAVIDGAARRAKSDPTRPAARVADDAPSKPLSPRPSPAATESSPPEDGAPAFAAPAPSARAAPPQPHRRLVPRGGRIAFAPEMLAEQHLIDPANPSGPLVEEFRLIKRQLLRNAAQLADGRRVLITSAQPDEGKTFTALNLAISLSAETDLSVVLIDGDTVRSDLSATLGIDEGDGLLEWLADPKLDLASLIVQTDLPRLAVLRAGRPTPRDAELLGSPRMGQLLDALEADAPERIILFDSTPLLATASPGVLAQACGQVIVVVRADVTRESALRDAVGVLGQHDAVSLLLNRVRFTPAGRRFGSYYGEGQ